MDADRAESERLQAERKLEAARNEAERRAEELRNADLKRQQLDAAEKATAVLCVRALDFATRGIGALVKSGEAADTLANVTMTLCTGEIENFLDGYIEQSRIQDGLHSVSTSQATAIKAVGRSSPKEVLLAVAVKARLQAGASTGNVDNRSQRKSDRRNGKARRRFGY